jgi:hypothetical protein
VAAVQLQQARVQQLTFAARPGPAFQQQLYIGKKDIEILK